MDMGEGEKHDLLERTDGFGSHMVDRVRDVSEHPAGTRGTPGDGWSCSSRNEMSEWTRRRVAAMDRFALRDERKGRTIRKRF